ncbi:hypothetical protein EC900091_5848, partial [Escherichia coli 90.0091]
MVITAASA